jgi:hypothetical protein
MKKGCAHGFKNRQKPVSRPDFLVHQTDWLELKKTRAVNQKTSWFIVENH